MTDTSDATPPSGGESNASPVAATRARNGRLAGLTTVALLLVGLGVFIAPFAFPIRPPVVSGVRATLVISPNEDKTRDNARISFRMNEAGTVSVLVNDRADRGGEVIRVLRQGTAPAGRLSVTWDGTDERGSRVPDGRYIVSIKARADSRSWNGSRPVFVDTTPPPIQSVAVDSAIGLRARGACRIRVQTAGEAGTLAIRTVAAGSRGPVVATRDPAPVARNATVTWSWDGTNGGRQVASGLYAIRTTLTDKLDNTQTAVRTCWVAHGGGALLGGRPERGDSVGVRLTDADGRPVDPSTPVTLSLARRNGDLGETALNVVGDPVGATARGPLRTVRLPLPRRIGLDKLWLVASTSRQRVVIPLRP